LGDNDRGDLVRYYFLYLQLQRIDEQKITGDIAELGVFEGNTALFINRISPHRRLHLFDSFEGFHERDSEKFATTDAFKDVSLEATKDRFPATVKFYVRYFPEAAASIEPGTRFAIVHIDIDLETPIFAALEFFYPLVNPSGAIIVHDYNNTISWSAAPRTPSIGFLSTSRKPLSRSQTDLAAS
jgi:O-methyltransferase